MTLAMADNSSGAASASAMNDAMTSGVAGSISMPPTISWSSWSRKLEPGRDAEVAAAAADRPEKVRVRLGVHPENPAVGGHDVGSQ